MRRGEMLVGEVVGSSTRVVEGLSGSCLEDSAGRDREKAAVKERCAKDKTGVGGSANCAPIISLEPCPPRDKGARWAQQPIANVPVQSHKPKRGMGSALLSLSALRPQPTRYDGIRGWFAAV